jgi:hypothetical protein
MKEKKLIDIMKTAKDIKTKKWQTILSLFKKDEDFEITNTILRNKWNTLKHTFKEKQLLRSSSGAGSEKYEIFDSDVLDEFVKAHPDSINHLKNEEI